MRLSLDRLFWARTTLSAAALSGCMFESAASAAGNGHHGRPVAASAGLWDGYQAPCQRCDSSWQGYGADPGCCQPQRPRNPILGLLDSVAGGVEQVLGLSGVRSRSCDEVACDDGCDALTLEHLQFQPHSMPAGTLFDPEHDALPEQQVPRPLPFVPGDAPGRVIERVPAPRAQGEADDPFTDEQAGRRKINPAISPSAYFE